MPNSTTRTGTRRIPNARNTYRWELRPGSARAAWPPRTERAPAACLLACVRASERASVRPCLLWMKHAGASPSRSPLGLHLQLPQSSRDSSGAHRLSLSSSCSGTSAKKALLFTEEGHRSEALGEISLNTLNSAVSVASASSPPLKDCTPHATGKPCPEAPRSVLRRRTPGQAAASTGHISFNPAQTNFDPSPSSLVKHSPRPPRWPAAQSPWLHRGLEQSDDEHAAIPRWEATPTASGTHRDLPHTSTSHRTPAAADNTRAVQDELLASEYELRTLFCLAGPRHLPCRAICSLTVRVRVMLAQCEWRTATCAA